MIAYLFIGWIAFIAAFLMKVVDRIGTGRFACRAIGFAGLIIGIRHAAGRCSSTTMRVAPEPGQRQIDSGLRLLKRQPGSGAALKRKATCRAPGWKASATI